MVFFQTDTSYGTACNFRACREHLARIGRAWDRRSAVRVHGEAAQRGMQPSARDVGVRNQAYCMMRSQRKYSLDSKE